MELSFFELLETIEVGEIWKSHKHFVRKNKLGGIVISTVGEPRIARVVIGEHERFELYEYKED